VAKISAFPPPVIVTALKLSNIQRHVFPENRPESFDGLSVDSTFTAARFKKTRQLLLPTDCVEKLGKRATSEIQTLVLQGR
jgi:hypothetical protein